MQNKLPNVSRESVLAAFCYHFEQLAHELETRGFDALVSEYLAQWMHSGQVCVAACCSVLQRFVVCCTNLEMRGCKLPVGEYLAQWMHAG